MLDLANALDDGRQLILQFLQESEEIGRHLGDNAYNQWEIKWSKSSSQGYAGEQKSELTRHIYPQLQTKWVSISMTHHDITKRVGVHVLNVAPLPTKLISISLRRHPYNRWVASGQWISVH